MSARPKTTAIAAATAALALALSACGGSTNDTKSTTAAAPPAIKSTGYFSAESPWNTPIESLPKQKGSEEMLQLARRREAVVELPDHRGFGTVERVAEKGIAVNSVRWAPLVVEAGGNDVVAMRMVCRQRDCGPVSERVPNTLALPAATTPDPSYDGWLSVIDRHEGVGYDFWRARRESGDTISYQFAKVWKLDGPGFSKPVAEEPERAAGARGSGLPLFAGVIGPAELRAGEINHALAISVPGLARGVYVQPASVTDGVGSPDSLPAGARIRLKSAALKSRPKGDSRASEEAILVALRRYGAIVVDRASVPTLYAAAGTPADLLQENELKWLDLSDFEVVRLPELLKDPPPNQVSEEGLATTVSAPVGGGGGG
ncbi:MAG: hypothetical protein BGO11_18590 [Solirubrobacterales bacterium 70-9]|nr:MAG: hypothetical protein BGO11_18590 [Solirubrobacterales bacterium 70-9]